MLVVPVTAVSCERVFCAQKRIKSDSRSSLGVDTLEDPIRIYVATCVEGDEVFDTP